MQRPESLGDKSQHAESWGTLGLGFFPRNIENPSRSNVQLHELNVQLWWFECCRLVHCPHVSQIISQLSSSIHHPSFFVIYTYQGVKMACWWRKTKMMCILGKCIEKKATSFHTSWTSNGLTILCWRCTSTFYSVTYMHGMSTML